MDSTITPPHNSPSHNSLPQLIIGMGKTGRSIAQFLSYLNQPFDCYDDKQQVIQNIQQQASEEREQFSGNGNYTHLRNGYHQGDLNNPLNHQTIETWLSGYLRLLVSPGVATDTPLIIAAKKLNIPCVTDLELFGEVVSPERIVAITGSNGKSTVTAWTAETLNQCGLTAIACGNIGKPMLQAWTVFQQQSKEPQSATATVSKSPTKSPIWVVEISSFQLEYTESVTAKIAVLLNITPDHLDRHKNLESYRQIKHKIFQQAKLKIYNRDDAICHPIDENPNTKTISFGQKINNHPENQQIEPSESSQLSQPSEQYALSDTNLIRLNQRSAIKQPTILFDCNQLPLYGTHNWLNAQAVWAIVHSFGIEDSSIAKNIVHWSGLPHRFELVKTQDGRQWINDSKSTNVGSLKAALESLATVKKNAHQVVLLIGGQTKKGDFSTLSALLKQHANQIILFGEDKFLIYQQLEPFNLPLLKTKSNESNLSDIIQICCKLSTSGDTILFSPGCASFDMFKSFKDRGNQFRQLVSQLTQSHQTLESSSTKTYNQTIQPQTE